MLTKEEEIALRFKFEEAAKDFDLSLGPLGTYQDLFVQDRWCIFKAENTK